MPTVLDELVIRLGLDGAAFQGQVQTTQSSLTKTGCDRAARGVVARGISQKDAG